jgi:hypothetical protein
VAESLRWVLAQALKDSASTAIRGLASRWVIHDP